MRVYQCTIALVTGVFATGLSVARSAEFAIVPVDAGAEHVIEGREITLFSGDTTVTFELRVSGWDRDGNGTPLLGGYEAKMDAGGFTSGERGQLSVVKTPCTTAADCPSLSECDESGFCYITRAIYIDTARPDYVFYGLGARALTNAFDWKFLGTLGLRGVADDGEPKYAGTLIVDVSHDAFGTFTLGVMESHESRMFDERTNPITPVDLLPATIVILSDCNHNGIPDVDDIAAGTSEDCNGNGRPDECEPDCNGNGMADECDVTSAVVDDCNGNLVPDECEPDCNENGIADECDVTSSHSEDCNGNIVPDECEIGAEEDCNHNGRPDLCDVFDGLSTDCNGNLVPDDCDIRGSSSRDCTRNGIPDECERDCNRNGLADSCDILRHRSEDADGDGVPDECIRGFALVPISATSGHVIEGSEITVPIGGTTVTLEMRVSGWDSGLGDDLHLEGYEVQFDPAGFTSGESGALALAEIACTEHDDCFAAAFCEAEGFCDPAGAAYVNTLHPNFVYAGLSGYAFYDFSGSDFRMAGGDSSPSWGAEDPGTDRYAATITLDVSSDATGTFTVGLLPEGTFWITSNGGSFALDLVPARITIEADCNGNGIRDDVDIADGTSQDAHGNGVPDECEFAMPAVMAEGGRYLTITPAPDTGPVALRVTSPQFQCLDKFVNPGDPFGRLSDTVIYLSPADWGTVTVVDPLIIPGTTYQVRAEIWQGPMSLGVAATTADWGDFVAPWGNVNELDVSAIVANFEKLTAAPATRQVDVYPLLPDNVIDLQDVVQAMNAVKGQSYALDVPCR